MWVFQEEARSVIDVPIDLPRPRLIARKNLSLVGGMRGYEFLDLGSKGLDHLFE